MRLENWSAIVYLIVSYDPEQCAKRQTLATDDDDRECCLLRSLDLFLDRGFEGGSEFAALMVGRFASGSNDCPETAPGLVERERRGQGIVAFLEYANEQQNAVVDVALSLRHTIRLVMYGVSVEEWRWEEINCIRFQWCKVTLELLSSRRRILPDLQLALRVRDSSTTARGFSDSHQRIFWRSLPPCWCSSSIPGRT